MRKIILIAAAIAMVLAFLPRVEAGESANLGLQVTFELPAPMPLKIWATDMNHVPIDVSQPLKVKEG